MIINGKTIAEEIVKKLAAKRTHYGELRLGVLMGVGDKATESFVRIKGRVAASLHIELVREELSSSATTKEALTHLSRLLATTDSVIVQLPLPVGVDAEEVLRHLPPERDPDALGIQGEALVSSPVVAAMQEILKKGQIPLRGKRIVLAGQGRLVGRPVSLWLHAARVTPVLVKDDIHMAREAPQADIIILGTGSPGILNPSMIKKGVVILDAGTSEASGKVVGDADPACADKARLFTPVPGGIGPIAVAMLFQNFFKLIERA